MSLESEGKEMSRLNTHRHTYIHTYRHVNIELEFCKTEFAMSQRNKTDNRQIEESAREKKTRAAKNRNFHSGQ